MSIRSEVSGKKIAIIGTTAASMYCFRAGLIRELVADGVEVYAFSLDYTSDSRQKIESLGAVAIDYDFSRTGLNPVSDIRCTFSLIRTLKHLAPDVVFSFFSKPVVFGTLAAKLAGVRRRVGMLEGLGYSFVDQPYPISVKTKLVKKTQVCLYRLSFLFLDRLIFLNPDDPVDLLSKYKLKVKHISILGGIGVNLQEFPYSAPSLEPIRFVFSGRLLAEKGVREFIEAAKIVKKKFSAAEFVMLGAVDEENPGSLKQNELDLLISKDIVVWPGHVEDVRVWLSTSSVFVLPSYREGIPLSTQEALAIGRPVITTDVPGCRETVIDGVNGYLIPPWSAESLANRMLRFIESPELIRKMSAESYSLARECFDERKVNKRLIRLLFEDVSCPVLEVKC